MTALIAVLFALIGDRRDPAEPPMTDWQEVSLLGGPFDGQVHVVHATRNLITIEYRNGSRKRPYGGEIRDVQQLAIESYRRVGDRVFQHCRTPTAIGDLDLELPESQLKLTEEEGE